MKFLKGLNDSQREAVLYNGKSSLMVIAGAGAGKTKMLTSKIAYIIKNGSIPSRIFVTTFTKKASEEMDDRLQLLIGNKTDRLKLGTSHSLFLRIYKDLRESQQKHDHPKLIMGGGRWMTMVKIINEHQFDKGGYNNRFVTKDIKGLLSKISYWKNEGKRVKDLIDHVKEHGIQLIDSDPDKNPNWKYTQMGTYIQAYKDYQKALNSQKRIDFDDFLIKTYYELSKKKNLKFLERLKKKTEHIFIDEAQDLNKIQFMLFDLISNGKNMTIVLDDYQCQPTGTMITMEGGNQKPIEELKMGDKVVSYSKRESRFAGSRNQGSEVLGIEYRTYKGKIYTIKANGRETKATPEHDWYVRFNNKSTDLCVVYMMRKGNKFRIGWCQLFYNNGGSHVLQRMRLEDADDIWILKTFENRKEASLHESYVAAKYGLPLIMFKSKGQEGHYDQEGLDKVFKKLGDLSIRANNCLKGHNRLIQYPFYSKSLGVSRGGSRVFKIATCNLIKEIMSVPIYNGNKKVEWAPIEIQKSKYTGKVYSLSVKHNNTYIADGIATHNCLYGFRGAKISYIKEFQNKYKPAVIKLEQNYRSTKDIVECGNKLIKHNEVQLWKNLFTENEQGMRTKVILSANVEEEADKLMEKIQGMILNGYDLGDIAILYRTNAQSRAIVDTFIINHIPHKVYSKEGFYDRKEVKDILAYLRICNDPNMAEPEDFRRIINRPTRFLGGKFIDNIEEIMFSNGYETFWQALQFWPELNMGTNQSNQAKKFVDVINRMSKLIETTKLSTKEILEEIVEQTGYLKWLNRELESADEEPDNDTGMNLNSLMFGAQRFNNPDEFLLFVDSMDYEENEDDDAIHCMTIHASKGKEFPVVFILGCCEKVMPHYKADDLEEERRIAYVAITRAKEELYISSIYEKFNNMKTEPSRFIYEMGAEMPDWYGGYKEEKRIEQKVNNKMAANAKRDKFEGTPTITKYDTKGKVIEIKPLEKQTETIRRILEK